MPEQQMTPEQVEELKEKLKNMSPEELKEFQKKQCIFCQIAAGKVKAKKVYEDNYVLAILDINPASAGHILLFPKEHYTILPQIADEEIVHLFAASKLLSNTLLKAVEARGTNILVANGPAAGQKAQHVIVHIIPRKDKDGINFSLPQREQNPDELEKIRQALTGKTGKKELKKEIELKPTEKIGKKPEKKIEIKPSEETEKIKKEKKSKKSVKKKTAKKPSKKEPVKLDDIADLFG